MSNTVAVRQALDDLIANDNIEVPMLPEVANKALRLTQDEDSEAAELARLIQSDQSLAGKVMRVANSAAYSPNSTIVSLQQAIARLGMGLISEIALAASINTQLFNAPGFEGHINYHIRFALASGLWAKEVARVCRKNVEAAFLSGLLHDIGRPVAVQSILEVSKRKACPLNFDEVLVLENDFQRLIGIRVLETWEMPSSVCHSLKYFEDYSVPHGGQFQTMLVVAGALVASRFLCESERNTQCMSEDELKAQSVFPDLNLYPDQIDDILEREAAVATALKALTR